MARQRLRRVTGRGRSSSKADSGFSAAGIGESRWHPVTRQKRTAVVPDTRRSKGSKGQARAFVSVRGKLQPAHVLRLGTTRFTSRGIAIPSAGAPSTASPGCWSVQQRRGRAGIALATVCTLVASGWSAAMRTKATTSPMSGAPPTARNGSAPVRRRRGAAQP